MRPTLLFLLLTTLSFGQNIPKLSLVPMNAGQQIKAPVTLEKGDLCVTVMVGGGMDAYNYLTHYIFSTDGTLQAYKEGIPVPYIKNLKPTKTKLELDEPAKAKLWEHLNSKITIDFTSLSQKDFRKPVKTTALFPPPCVTDAAGYSISFAQDHKHKAFTFYAPEYYLDGTCKDESVNTKMVQKFVQLLALWEVDITVVENQKK